MNRLSLLFAAGLLSLLIVGGMFGYAYYGNSTSGDSIKKYDLQISSLENDLKQFKGESLKAALSAKSTLDDVKKDSIKWSTVIEKVLLTTPKDPTTKSPVVEYTSYSASQNSDISISVRTVPGSTAPFSDVAQLIRAFSNSEYFSDPFVPSISTSTDKTGDVVLVFNFNVNYKK